MNNLFDIMMKAQDGEAMETLAGQFGLKKEQTEQVVELMMPAFSNGLKRNTNDSMGLMNFMSALSSGQHQKYHDDPNQAFRDDAINEGNEILGHLFGSKDTSRAVADQVALSSGVGSTILKQMLPVIASMVMGGLFKGTSTQSTSNPMGDLLGNIMKNMAGGGMPGMTPQGGGSQNPVADNPFGKMMEDFMGSAMGGTARAAPEKPKAPERGEDIFGDMFEAGRKVQDDYKKNVDSIFDNYLDGMRKL
ncbi:MAG: DUF937 domain-containing protein [Hyphomicrobiales bacterium]